MTVCVSAAYLQTQSDSYVCANTGYYGHSFTALPTEDRFGYYKCLTDP